MSLEGRKCLLQLRAHFLREDGDLGYAGEGEGEKGDFAMDSVGLEGDETEKADAHFVGVGYVSGSGTTLLLSQ